MPNIDTPSTVAITVRSSGDLLFNISGVQTPGVGGSGGDYQAQSGGNKQVTLTDGVIISRFISNYDAGTDTKTGIETEFGIGGWPIHDNVDDLGSSAEFFILSNNNLTAGTTYNGLHFWISDYYYNRIFLVEDRTLQDAIDNTDSQPGTQIFPSGDAVLASNGITIVGTTSPATSITGSFTVVSGASAGSVVGTASSDRNNGTWSITSQDASLLTVNSGTGIVSVDTGQTVGSAGSYSFTLQYDNSSITGGGTYSEAQTLTITEAGVETAKFIPIPVKNIDASNWTTAKTIVDAFASNFSAARTTYSVPTGTPVIEVAAGSHGNLSWSNVNLSEEVVVRGNGSAYSRDDYTPTAATKGGRLLLTNVTNLTIMGIEFESPTTGGSSDDVNHRLTDCTTCKVIRNCLHGDIARSTSALATTPSSGVQNLINPSGSTNCEIVQNSIMGYRNAVGSVNGSSDGTIFKGNVVAQGADDLLKFNSGTHDNWEVLDNLGLGKGRNPGDRHRDFIQIFSPNSSANARNWLIQGNWVQSGSGWGSDTYLAKQGCFWGNGSNASSATIIDNFFGLTGKGVAGNHDGANIRFNTFMIPIDSLGSENSNGRFTANNAGFSAFGSFVADENIVTNRSNTTGVGPNGVSIQNTGHIGADNEGTFGVSYNWATMGAYLVNFDQTFSSVSNIKSEVSPREEGGVEQYLIDTGTRMHWDNADPTGCFQLFERVFDPVTHDHWKDWGWPCAPAAHLYYDIGNNMGGTSGAYNSFDANGA